MKQVSGVFGTKVLDYAMRFATAVLIARWLGPADKGVLTFAMLLVVWTSLLGDFSLMDAHIFLMGSRQFSIGEATVTSLVISLVMGTFYVAGWLAATWMGLMKVEAVHLLVFCLLFLSIPFNLFVNSVTCILQGSGKFVVFNRVTLSRAAISLLLVAAAVAIWTRPSLTAIAVAVLAGNVINALVAGTVAIRVGNQQLRFSWEYLRAAARYGIRSYPRLVLSQMAVKLDQLLLGMMLAPVFLGWYSIALSIGEGLLMLPEAISVVLFPRVAGDRANADALMSRACRVNLMAMIVAVGIIALLAQPLILVIYGQSFLESVQPLHVLLGATLLRSVSRILINYVYGVGRPQLAIISVGVAAGVMLALMVPLIRQWGMMGAALASLAGYACGTVADLIIIRRISSVRLADLLIPRVSDWKLSGNQGTF